MPEELLAATTKADLVEVPARTVLSLEGQGGPEDPSFASAIAALYGVVYTLKFTRKRGGDGDFKVGPLEARWWIFDPRRPSAEARRGDWRWRLRLAVPEDVCEEEVAQSVAAATGRKGGKLSGNAEATRVAVERVPATRQGRILHVGPYASEGASFEKIRQVLPGPADPGAGHVEIYLNDPRRTRPEKLKTILLLDLPGAGGHGERRA